MFLCVDVLSCLLFVVQPGALCGVLVGFIYYNENNVIKLAVLVFLILSYANNINGYSESKEISANKHNYNDGNKRSPMADIKMCQKIRFNYKW